MLKVHVWLPHQGLVGHASLSFGTDYVSFWPKTSAGKKDLKVKRSQPGHFMNALAEDVLSEGGRQPITVVIPNINKQELSKFVANLISNTPEYQLARYNCSHVVAECLKVACRQEASFRPNARDYSKLGKILGQGIWTPNEILRYAKELAARNVR
ncbi:hypothetical protein N9M10_01720 [Hellea sp.]|nr:hypothetical protein [Hellea sp.]